MPGRIELKPTLAKIWHAADHFRLMDPLPSMHRRGIILGVVLVVVGILLPSDDNSPAPASREAQLDIQPQSQMTPASPETPEVVMPSASDQLQQAQTPQPVEQTPAPSPEPARQQAAAAPGTHTAPTGIEQQWRSYRVESGKTLAQLFRDNSLPPADAYAMAQVEGDGKPLSSLQSGQMVKIRQNASGVVTGLTIEQNGDQQALFTRQPDGSFIRAR